MQISHRFVKLSQEDSGKQHLFTWRDDDGRFLCHVMYQSGADLLDIPDHGTAQRGQILRILTKEIPPEQEAALAPSKDSETGTIRLPIKGDNWEAKDYANVAKMALENPKLDGPQKCAVICQLASLYNLMATRYGQLFDLKLTDLSQKNIDALVTDAQLSQASIWFVKQAGALLKDRPALEGMPESVATTEETSQAKLTFSHGIEAHAKQKIHVFSIKDANGKILITAEYQSGTLGENIIINYPLPDDKSVAIPYNLMDLPPEEMHRTISHAMQHNLSYNQLRDMTAHLYYPLPANYQIQKLDYFRQMYDLTEDQQAATLLMLGSVTRLFSTRFQREFDDISMTNMDEVQGYVKDKYISKIADDLIAAATKLLRDGRFEYPHLAVVHKHLGTGQAVKELEPGVKTLDITFHPPLDNWALTFTATGPDFVFFDRYPCHTDSSPGQFEVKRGIRK